jgi:hypothetical protein
MRATMIGASALLVLTGCQNLVAPALDSVRCYVRHLEERVATAKLLWDLNQGGARCPQKRPARVSIPKESQCC